MPTPNLQLPIAPAGATDLSVAFNDAMQIVDAMSPLVVQDKDLTAPPTTVSGDAGKRWIIATGATGAWAGKDGQIALSTGADLWKYLVAPLYHIAYVVDEAAEYRRGPGGWSAV